MIFMEVSYRPFASIRVLVSTKNWVAIGIGPNFGIGTSLVTYHWSMGWLLTVDRVTIWTRKCTECLWLKYVARLILPNVAIWLILPNVAMWLILPNVAMWLILPNVAIILPNVAMWLVLPNVAIILPNVAMWLVLPNVAIILPNTFPSSTPSIVTASLSASPTPATMCWRTCRGGGTKRTSLTRWYFVSTASRWALFVLCCIGVLSCVVWLAKGWSACDSCFWGVHNEAEFH